MAASPVETEVKLAISDPETGRRMLEERGFRVSVERVFEANAVYDTADGSIRAAGALLRLRQAGTRSVLTYKGPATPGRHKSRPEIETGVDDFEIMHRILESIGYKTLFRYEKYRTEFTASGVPGVATLDETPIGTYLELEGPSEWIDETAAALGFSEADYVTDSYGALYSKFCTLNGIVPNNMVFASDTP